MKYEEMKVGMRVYDNWWPWRFYGKIISLTKRRAYILQPDLQLHYYPRSAYHFLIKTSE